MTLNEIRDRIDAIDQQLLELFRQRMECAKEVAQIKKEQHLPIAHPQREQDIIDMRTRQLPAHEAEVRRLFELLIELSRQYQEQLLADDPFYRTNIVLIGMPGSGKSSVGKELASLAGRTLLDCDAEIVRRTGISIPSYFEQYGEDEFRKLESQVVSDFSEQTGVILVTGGGVVTREENYAPLHRNGWMVQIERPLEDLAQEGRPMFERFTAQQLYEQRKAAYAHFKDAVVPYTQDARQTAQCIWDCYQEQFAK